MGIVINRPPRGQATTEASSVKPVRAKKLITKPNPLMSTLELAIIIFPAFLRGQLDPLRATFTSYNLSKPIRPHDYLINI